MLSEGDWEWIQKIGLATRPPQCKNVGKYRICLVFRNKMEICIAERIFNDYVAIGCQNGDYRTYSTLDSVWKVEKFIGR